MGNILVKVHESYRWVVAVCDEDVFGRKLVEEPGTRNQESEGGGEPRNSVPSNLGTSEEVSSLSGRVLDVSGAFFDGKAMSESEARDEIVRCAREDATFNFVGKESVGLAKELGIVKDEGVLEIDGVPFALVLM